MESWSLTAYLLACQRKLCFRQNFPFNRRTKTSGECATDTNARTWSARSPLSRFTQPSYNTHTMVSVVLLPLHLCDDTGISPYEVSFRCDATDPDTSSTCSTGDDGERSDSSVSDAPTFMMKPIHPKKSHSLALLQDVPLHLRPTGGIKDPKRFKTTFCNKYQNFGRCPFGSKCQHAHSQEEIDFWNKMRMNGSRLVWF